MVLPHWWENYCLILWVDWWVVWIAYCFKKKNFVYSSSSTYTQRMKIFVLRCIMSEADTKCRRLPENFPVVLVSYKLCICAYMCKEQMLMLVFPSGVPLRYSLLCYPYSLQQSIAGSSPCQPPDTFVLSRIGVMLSSTKFSGQSLSCTSEQPSSCLGESEGSLESFLSLGVMKLAYFVNKAELGKPWASLHIETAIWLLNAQNAHRRKEMTGLRLCLASKDCLCHSVLICGFICSLEQGEWLEFCS